MKHSNYPMQKNKSNGIHPIPQMCMAEKKISVVGICWCRCYQINRQHIFNHVNWQHKF